MGRLTFRLLSFHGSATEGLLTGESLAGLEGVGGGMPTNQIVFHPTPTYFLHPKNNSMMGELLVF